MGQSVKPFRASVQRGTEDRRFADTARKWWRQGRASLACAAVCVVAFVAGQRLLGDLPSDQANVLEIDAAISAGNFLEVYVNGSGYPVKVDRTTDARVTYQFPGMPGFLKEIRIDPTDAQGARVTVYGMRLVQAGTPIKAWSASAVQSGGGRDGMELRSTSEQEAAYETTYKDPKLYFREQIQFPTDSSVRALLNLLLRYAPYWVVGVGIVAILVMQPRMLIAPRAVAMYVAIIGIGGAAFVARNVPLPAKFHPVIHAAGLSAFAGYPKATEFLRYWCLIGGALAAIALAWCVGYLLTAREEKVVALVPARRVSFFGTLVNVAAVAFVPVVLFFAYFPAMRASIQSLNETSGVVGFDSINVFSWAAYRLLGWLPHKDYWFPYGGFDRQMHSLPFSMARAHLHYSLVWCVLAACLYRVLERSKGWTVGCMLALLLLEANGQLSAFARYFMGVTVVLGFVATFYERRSRVVAVLFGCYLAYVASCEAHQLIYSIPACGVLAAVLVWRERRALTGLFTYALWAVVPCISGIVAWVAQLQMRGQLEDFLKFYLRGDGMIATASIPTGLHQWLAFQASPEGILLALVVAVLVCGVIAAIPLRRGAFTASHAAIVGLGMLGVMVYLKQLTRPHIAAQLVGIPLCGAMLIAAMWWRAWNIKQRAIAAGIAGVMLAYIGIVGNGAIIFKNYWNRAWTVGPDIALALQGEQPYIADELKLLEPSRFATHYSMVAPLMDEISRFERDQGRRPAVYVLGDGGFVYAMLRQKPPRFISFYDMSDIRAQQEVRAWLGTTEPDFVVWDPAFDSFDGVPHLVRVPLVYRYVTEHYQFAKKIGDSHLLVRRGSDAPIDLGYWRQYLGKSIDFGAIPALTTLPQVERCERAGIGSCILTVRAQLPEVPTTADRLVLTFSRGTESFDAVISTLPGKQRYTLPVERLWFISRERVGDWQVSCRVGTAPCAATFEARRPRGQLLY